MVAIFKTGSSLKGSLNYNEKKVQKGVAKCIHAEHFPMDHDRMSFHHKMSWLQHYASLNTNVKANAVHISLNFDPSEKLPDERLKEIAGAYMQQIGFGEQPYLVYRHEDAGHPHIHIVSVKVDETGKRIDTQNIGKNKSETARKNIEKLFGLVRAEDSKNKEKYQLEAVSAAKVQYGKAATKRAISNVLAHVLKQYKFSSLPELNAVLRLYNVMADRGGENSRMYKENGLMFRALDEQGKKIGAPIKASAFYMQPTMKKLEVLFSQNEPLKTLLRDRTRTTISRALLGVKGTTIEELVKLLEAQNIRCILRQNEHGRVYGITYVDIKNKVVFNGSDLGKPYSANGMLERCKMDIGGMHLMSSEKVLSKEEAGSQQKQESLPAHIQKKTGEGGVIDILTQTEDTYTPVPFPLKKTRKKKKKGNRL